MLCGKAPSTRQEGIYLPWMFVLKCEQPGIGWGAEPMVARMTKPFRLDKSWQSVIYLPDKQCLKRADVILTIGGDGTILHEANLSLKHAKPILGVNLGRCGFLATCEVDEMETKLAAVAGAISSWTTGCCSTPMFWAMTAGKAMH